MRAVRSKNSSRLSFTDSASLGVFHANVAAFFVDEGPEWGNGSVGSIPSFDSLVVPEPHVALLLGSGLAALAHRRRARETAAARVRTPSGEGL